MPSEMLLFRREVARMYVEEIRAKTVCIRCGGQPIEWHHESHSKGRYNYRISGLVTRGYLVDRIQREIDICTAMCRSCHMKEDGRTEALLEARPYKKGYRAPLKHCVECNGLYKPMRQGLCNRCYKRKYG